MIIILVRLLIARRLYAAILAQIVLKPLVKMWRVLINQHYYKKGIKPCERMGIK